LATARQLLLSVAVAKKAIVADALEPVGQDLEQETAKIKTRPKIM
jgi:hypothetical protein